MLNVMVLAARAEAIAALHARTEATAAPHARTVRVVRVVAAAAVAVN